jgi:pimeloyl-ACP methyl ester carboxylesterase
MQQLATLITIGRTHLLADINVPDRSKGLVIFAHGSGSSRYSSRNRHVAEVLNRGAIGTVLVDLLTEEEELIDHKTAELRFDIPLLGRRLARITDWAGRQKALENLAVGYFGASTGAAAALAAAAERPPLVKAVVSRGGRPDLAAPALCKVIAPALFIVGSEDHVVLELNRRAMAGLPRQTGRKLEVIPGATHLFEEPGALDQVAALAREWFRTHLPK